MISTYSHKLYHNTGHVLTLIDYFELIKVQLRLILWLSALNFAITYTLIINYKIQVFVETLDRCFENVCELDLIFHVDKVHNILQEVCMGGMVLETNMTEILTHVEAQNKLEKSEASPTSAIRVRQYIAISTFFLFYVCIVLVHEN